MKIVEGSKNVCVMCYSEIKDGDKEVVIFEDRFCKVAVHASECWFEYQMLIYGQDEEVHGPILGLCEVCFKPVRLGHRFFHKVKNVYPSDFYGKEARTVISPSESVVAITAYGHAACLPGVEERMDEDMYELHLQEQKEQEEADIEDGNYYHVEEDGSIVYRA